VTLPRPGSFSAAFCDVFTVAVCFTLFGPYIDGLLRALPGIEVGPGRLVRVVGLFAGGLWCYLIGRWLWIKYVRDLNELPGLIWGGVFLVICQPVMHRVTRRHAPTPS